MPTYDYKCTACSHLFEQFQSIKDKPLKTCPKCGKKALERLIGTGGAIIFKGGGFYQTDYRSESYKKSAEADKPSGSGGENQGEKTKETPSVKRPENKAGETSNASQKVGGTEKEVKKPAEASASRSKTRSRTRAD
jgi:putative FmdB family regulatory protein